MPPTEHRIDQLNAKLQRAIIHGLVLQWDQIRAELPPDLQSRLRPPMMSLRPMRRRWAFFDLQHREMAFSITLVTSHPWDAVVDVLRHEMAHQLSLEIMGGAGQRPHGATFLKACKLLQADPRASGQYPTLKERIRQNGSTPADRILRRIQKLMSLAASNHPHEAESAMAKAHELMARYQYDLIESDTKRSFFSQFAGAPALRHFQWAYRLAHLLEAYYFVQGVWVPAYIIAKQRMGKVLEISGTAANVQMAAYVHDCVTRWIDRTWHQLKAMGRRRNGYRRDQFALGVVEGFERKLASTRQAMKAADSALALVLAADPQLDTYVDQRYPRLTCFRRSSLADSDRGYDDGVQAGARLVISKPVASHSKKTGLLPT